MRAWIISNWLAVLGVLATIVFGLLATILGYLAIRKPRWKKYCCRRLPYGRILREKEYGHDPKTFLSNVGSLDRNFRTIRDWHAGKTKPLLVKGATGVGKSRLVTEFLRQLGFWERLTIRVLMPTPDDVREKIPPRFMRKCILFLNDLHEYRDFVGNPGPIDQRLIQLIQDKKFRVVATIPTEVYDPGWSVLQSYLWEEMKVEQWTEDEGKRLAKARNIAFDSTGFTGTPLSVIAPAAEIRRRFDLLPKDRKAVLEALKIVKTHLGCYASWELASSLTVPSGKFDNYAFRDITVRQELWCKTDDSAAMLADEVEDSIRYDVSIGDAYGLQDILMRNERAVKGRDEYLFYLGNRFSKLGDFGRALACYDRSKDLSPRNPSPWVNRALVLTTLGRIKDALDSYKRAKRLFKRRGNQSGVAAILHQLGTIEQRRGNYPDAIELFNESIETWRAVNNDLGAAMALHHLGMIEQAKRNYPRARDFYNLSLGIKRKLGARPELAVTLSNLATIELKEGNLKEAKSLYGESLDILKESGDLVGMANALHQLAIIEQERGNNSEAKKLYDQSLEIKRNLESTRKSLERVRLMRQKP